MRLAMTKLINCSRSMKPNIMPKPDRDPLGELLKYAIVAAGMCLTMLVLTRGKWLTALLIGVWLGFVWLRFKRAAKKANR